MTCGSSFDAVYVGWNHADVAQRDAYVAQCTEYLQQCIGRTADVAQGAAQNGDVDKDADAISWAACDFCDSRPVRRYADLPECAADLAGGADSYERMFCHRCNLCVAIAEMARASADVANGAAGWTASSPTHVTSVAAGTELLMCPAPELPFECFLENPLWAVQRGFRLPHASLSDAALQSRWDLITDFFHYFYSYVLKD
jgi:hypothetical protein